MGEIEVVFGLWSIVLLIAMVTYAGWETATHYFNDGVNYTEPLFVVVIMALAATRPIIAFAEAAMKRIANIRPLYSGGMVADDSHGRPAAGIIHH